ncbi:hypothetical protein LX83_005106 [Goodfellowiella coeruleoviolacea]|uniref:Uncharacterized protein n=1 Tax=Goodfellowiella coeruleoviolacea TaxID=334858 RepID=A0AAE3GIG2_9PSEU|nr:hypothetical protein [Goodfellowiella coeruleoviolacea]
MVPHLAIAATAWATTTGVPRPSENTSSNTQAISLPTSSAMSSRIISRTKATTSPMIMVTVLMAFAAVAAAAMASSCSLADARYASAAPPRQFAVPCCTASANWVRTSPTALATLPQVSA